ncbi:MAG: response regulator transcription factor [Chloroflexota bacterium]
MNPNRTLYFKNSLPAAHRILILDAAPEIRHVAGIHLERAGFEVWLAGSTQEALTRIERYGLPHLAVVNVQLPGLDGFEFCRRAQQLGDLPVIMLTASSEGDVVVKALEHYAEDVIITKPLQPAQLVARVQRVLRRIKDFDYTHDPLTQVDRHFSLDLPGRQAIIDGEIVPLTPIEARLLFILMRNAGRFIPTHTLVNRLWPLESAQEDRLHVHVSRLRRKIEALPTRPDYLVSRRGSGYSLQLTR